LETFFDTNTVSIKGEDVSIKLIAERLRGEVASFDIVGPNGKVIVETGRRITARHVRLLEDSGMKQLAVPREYLLEQITAKDIVDESTGEVAVPCNSIITEEVLEKLFELKVSSLETIYTNDLDCGPFISDTMRVDPSSTKLEALVEIYRMMRPGEPPTKESAENLFSNLFFSNDRYDLSGVGRMKFNRRLGREEIVGEGILSKKTLSTC
jgi:DNA-directed RNA polymerase subunit beta